MDQNTQTNDYQPTNGCISVKASSIHEAFEKIAEALNSHPDIAVDWIDGIEIEN